MSPAYQRAWQLAQQRLAREAEQRLALPPKPDNWERYSALEKRTWMLQAQEFARQQQSGGGGA
jgi:hypothetical protein